MQNLFVETKPKVSREEVSLLSVDGESLPEAQQMHDANYKEETQNKHLF